MRLINLDELCRTLDERVGSPEGDAKLMEINRSRPYMHGKKA